MAADRKKNQYLEAKPEVGKSESWTRSSIALATIEKYKLSEILHTLLSSIKKNFQYIEMMNVEFIKGQNKMYFRKRRRQRKR